MTTMLDTNLKKVLKLCKHCVNNHYRLASKKNDVNILNKTQIDVIFILKYFKNKLNPNKIR